MTEAEQIAGALPAFMMAGGKDAVKDITSSLSDLRFNIYANV